MPGAPSVENDVRSAALSAATRLFAERGFDGTALQDIADAVGVTKPAILHHYPTKELIRHAVLDTIFEHWNKILPRLLLAATTRSGRFEAVFGELHDFFASDTDRARLLIREALDRPVEMRKLLRTTIRPWLSGVADYVRAGRDAGTYYADLDPEAYVLHVMQFVIAAEACGAVTRVVLTPSSGARSDEAESVERYTQELTRIAKSSLFAHAPEAAPTTTKRKRAR